MKADVLKRAEACSGPCEKCANRTIVFGPQGTICKFGPDGPITDGFREGKVESSVTYSKKEGLHDR